jgi:lysophospholipase L1-like esterase
MNCRRKLQQLWSLCLGLLFASAVSAMPWTYTAMGDSLAAGVGATNSNGYVPRFSALAQSDTGNTVTLNNLGVSGWNSAQLLNAIRADQNFRNAIANSHVVTWDIGGNDLTGPLNSFLFGSCGGTDNQNCLRAAVAQLNSNWDAIMAEIISLRNPNTTVLRTMNIYNPFVNFLRLTNALTVANFYLAQVNDHIEESCRNNHVVMANVFYAFNGANGEEDAGDKGLLFTDNFHPNDAGYTIITNLFREARYAPLFGHSNSIDDSRYYVSQHYRDFLVRQPDTAGADYWTEQIAGNAANNPPPCAPGNAQCQTQRRVNVSAAFFIELEFQQTGSFVYRFYKSGLGRNPNYAEFSADRRLIIGGNNIEQLRLNFATNWVQRAAFTAKYPLTQTADQFVDALLATAQQASGVNLTGMRQTLLNEYAGQANQTASRARVTRLVAEAQAFQTAEYNKAFVLMQYFGYLKRNIDQAGYDFWLNVVTNVQPGNYRGMVCAFVTSAEYQLRFGSLTTRANQDCAGIQ